ncbi:hypothetical protein BGP75_21040 [Motiliproteus sp. MSK22-1]|nr:hypothetical protein BGP75_21040 [Motiliproteus sp. MSK22-1]
MIQLIPITVEGGDMRILTTFAGALLLLISGISYGDSQTTRQSAIFMASDYPPYDIASGTIDQQGFDVDVILAAYKRVSTDIKVQFLPWKRASIIAAKGLSAGLITCAKTKSREPLFYFSDPISFATVAIIVRADYQGPELTSLAKAKNLRFGGVLNYATNKYLEKENMPYKTYRSDKLLLRDLTAGVIDAFMAPKEATFYFAQQMGIADKLKSFNVLEGRPYHICISKQYPEAENLLNLFNKGLSELKQDGTYQKIHNRYK